MQYDNYIQMKDKWVTSCATNYFWMLKLILLKIIFIVLGDTTLLFIIFWTLCKRPSLWCYGVKSVKHKWCEKMLTAEYIFSCLTTLPEASWRATCNTVKVSVFNLTNGETTAKFTLACFPSAHSYTITSVSLRVDLWICQKVHKYLFFRRYFCAFKNIKKNISDKVVPVFKVWKLSTIYCVLPKIIRIHLTKNRVNLINKKKGIMMQNKNGCSILFLWKYIK
jgi:hypothetical protein